MLRANGETGMTARTLDTSASDSDGKGVAKDPRAAIDAVFAAVADDIDDEEAWSAESERADSDALADSSSDESDAAEDCDGDESCDEMVIEEPFGYEAASAGALLDPEALEEAPAYKGVAVEPVSLDNILPAGSRRRTPARMAH